MSQIEPIYNDEDLSSEELEQHLEDLQHKLLEALEEEAEYIRFNRLEYFDPYPFQVEFLNSHASEIALRAANQIGKTMSGTAWDAMDLTGRYPDWYEGIKTDKPITLVVGCVNNDKTRDILQKELFGDPIEWEEELGSGWIPADCIGKIQKKRGVPDAFYNVRVKHHDPITGEFDGWSKIVFLAYEMGKSTWMAHKADITHLDEECPADILEQAARSGIATGGRIRMTFTPENGVTSVVKMVTNDWDLHTAEWKDVAGNDFAIMIEGEEFAFRTIVTLGGKAGHLTEEKVLAAARKIPAHSMKMRMRGIPVLGSGLVFRFPEEQIKIPAIEFPEHFEFLDGIDHGGMSSNAHPTAFVRGAYDPTNDVIIIYDGFKMQGKEIPEIAAHINMKTNSDIIPVVYPHDSNKGKDGERTRDQYYEAGVNMFYNEDNPDKSHATNPPREGKQEGFGGNKIMPGIDEMSIRMNDSRLKIVDSVYEFWEEYRTYHTKDGIIVDIDDDFMSAVRYIVMMIRHAVTLERKVIKFGGNGSSSASGWMAG